MANHIETRCIHGNSDFSFVEETHALSFPLYQTATFGHLVGHSTGFDYTHEKNPTRQLNTISAKNGLQISFANTTDIKNAEVLLCPETNACRLAGALDMSLSP